MRKEKEKKKKRRERENTTKYKRTGASKALVWSRGWMRRREVGVVETDERTETGKGEDKPFAGSRD